jgi:threonine/homoserine/homoserine lactone efflux protein
VARSTVSIDEVQDEATIGRAGLTGFGMTLSNPATIFGFIAVFGALGDLAPDTGDYVGAAFLVLGVAAGGFGWWFLLVSLIALVRRRMTLRGLERINHAAGGVLLLCGFGLLARVVWVMVTSPA